MTESKETKRCKSEPKQDQKNSEKQGGTQIRLTLNDLMVLGFNMVKSGFGLIQSLEKVIDSKFQEMVDKGELKPDEANKIKDDVRSTLNNSMGNFTSKINDGIRGTLNRLNIATLSDLQSLETRLDTLLEKIDTIVEKKKKKTTTKRTRTPKTK